MLPPPEVKSTRRRGGKRLRPTRDPEKNGVGSTRLESHETTDANGQKSNKYTKIECEVRGGYHV